MDAASAVGSQMGDIAVLHHPDQVTGQTALDHVGTDETGNSLASLLSGVQLLNQNLEFGAHEQVVILLAGGSQGVDTNQIVAVCGSEGFGLAQI